MRTKEQSQEQPSSKKEVKPPGAWSKLLDKFGLGNRWEQEVAYLESIDEQEQTPETVAEAEKAVSRIESQIDAEISAGISELQTDLTTAQQDIVAYGTADPALQEELSQVARKIKDASTQFIPIETIDVETLDPEEIELVAEPPVTETSTAHAEPTDPSTTPPASYGLEGMAQIPDMFSEADTEEADDGAEEFETAPKPLPTVSLSETKSTGLEGMVDMPDIVSVFGIETTEEDYTATESPTTTETLDITSDSPRTVADTSADVSNRDLPPTSERDSTSSISETANEDTADTSEVEPTPRERATKELFAATNTLFGKNRIENSEAFQTQEHEFFNRIADNLKDFLPATTEYATAADEFLSEMRALLEELKSFDRNIDRALIKINQQPDQGDLRLAIEFSNVAETFILEKGTELLQRLEAQTDVLNRFIRKTRESADLSHSAEAEEVHQALRNFALATAEVQQDIAEKQRIYVNNVEPAKDNLLTILSSEETETSKAA